MPDDLNKKVEEMNPTVTTAVAAADAEEQVTETQVRRYKQLRNASASESRRGRTLNAANLKKRVEVFDQMAEDPDFSGCIIKWKRLHPRIHPHTRETLTTVHKDMSVPMCKWVDVCASIKEMNGGGRYRVEVINEGGQSEHILEATIDIDEFPPQNPPNAAYPQYQSPQSQIKNDVVSKQIENKIKRDEEAANLEHQIKLQDLQNKRDNAEFQREDRERRRKIEEEERERKRREEGEGGMNSPIVHIMMEGMKSIQDSIKSSNESIARVLEKMSEPKEDKTMPLMMQMFTMQMETMKNQNAKDIARIEAEAKKPKDDSSDRYMNMMMQVQQETTKLVTQIALSGKQDKTTETLLQVLVGNLKDASSSKNSSLKEAMGVITMAKGLFMDGEVPDMEEQPQSPWVSALSSIGSGIGNALTQKLMGGVPGQQPPVLPNNQSLLPSSNPDGSADVNFEDDDKSPIVPPPPQNKPVSPDPSTPEGKLFITMSQLMKIALQDMTEEKREHRWIIPAVNNLPQEFLDMISKIPSDAEGDEMILDKIQAYTDQRIYTHILNIINDQSKFDTCYVNFFSAWNQVKELYRDGQKQKKKAENNATTAQTASS